MNLTKQGAGLVAFAGFALAAPLTAWLSWPSAPEPAPQPAACERADELGARLIAARAVLAQEVARLERVRAEDLRMTGDPPERPDDLPPELSGEAARQAVGRALAPSGARTTHVCTAATGGDLDDAALDIDLAVGDSRVGADHLGGRGLLGLRHGVKIRQAVHELLVPPPALLLAMGGVCELQGLLLRRHGEAVGCEELCLGRDEVLENTQGAAGLLGALDELRSG